MRIATLQKYHPLIKNPKCLIIFEHQYKIMRNTLTTLVLLAVAAQAQAQLLPNGSFEDWTGSGTSLQIGGGWRGTGRLTRFESLQVNSQSGTEFRLPAGGRYFIGLQNAISGQQGVLGSISNRFAFNQRPVSMRTAVMFFPGSVPGESWGFSILFLKNKMGGGKDTILRAGGVLNPQGIGDWGQFTVGLSQLYNPSFTANPDTAVVVFSLTPAGTQISAAGLLALDMMTFTDFAVSAKPFSVDAVGQVNVFPNPASNTPVQFSFRNGMKGQGRLDVYNLQGQLVKTLFNGTLEQGAHQYTLPAGSLGQGMYIYRLTHEGGVKEGKFAIQ
jgi:hypothetical protein